MNIFDRNNFDFESLTGQLIWFNVVSHSDEYSGYDIIQNISEKSFWNEIENPYPRGNKPGDIVRDTTFLSYSIGPVRRLTWKELCLALGFYKDILLPDYHNCLKCEEYKKCKAYFKDDPKQERCNSWERNHKNEIPDLEEEYKKFIDDLLNKPSKCCLDYLKLVSDVYKKTLYYELDEIKVNDDGTTTHLHSPKFLNEHPERKDSPEFTEKEENEQVGLIAKTAYEMAKKYGSLFKENFDNKNI